MTNTYDWKGNVGDSWAAEWQRTDRSLEAVNAALVSKVSARAFSGAKLLDIGCGAGATSLALAQALPQADILGIDLSQSLIEAARARANLPNVRFERHDATHWQGAAWQPDLLVSRHGVMFFDDPVAAFSHFARQAAGEAQLVFSCFRAREENDWVKAIMAELPVRPPPSDPLAPGPFAFADPERVEAILSSSGWKDVQAEPLDFSYVAGGGSDPVADAIAFFQRIGPAAPILRELDDESRTRALARLSEVFCNHFEDGSVSFKAAAWIWTAHL